MQKKKNPSIFWLDLVQSENEKHEFSLAYTCIIV